MSSDDCLLDLQQDSADDFLYSEINNDPVIKWGPKKDIGNFLQQTVNCLYACKMAIECRFGRMSTQSLQAKWDIITNSPSCNIPSLNSNFVHTLDYKIKAKSIESMDLAAQQFWMFHRVDLKEIYVVFPSQEISAYILSDADVWKMPRQKDIASVDNIPISLFKGLIQQGYQLVLTGHSLGGAIAILATYKLLMKDLDDTQIGKIRCITFGAPLVPYQQLEQIFILDKVIFRYELPEDPVPQLLTAFQRADNPSQEFLINLMNLLDLPNSFKHTEDMDFGLTDFVELSKAQVCEIKKSGNFGTVFVPQDKLILLGASQNYYQYYMDRQQEWHLLQNLNQDGSQQQTKLFLSEFIEDLREHHQFERYVQELFQWRINKQIIKLPMVGAKLQTEDTVEFRIPGRDKWTCNPNNLNDHQNQVKAYFDEKFTKVIVTSRDPHVLSIRFGEIQQYPKWGKVASEIQPDWSVYKVKFVFYSADDFKDIKKNNLLKIKLYGCFENVENIEVTAEQSCGEDASEIWSSAYKNVNLQQLYISAFQACLFAGEGHNPMLSAENSSEKQRSALLKEDHESLVEILGSLIVNQKCLEIILKENQGQFQNKWTKQQKFGTCDTKILKDFEYTEDNEDRNQQKLVDLAKKNLNVLYNSFKYNPKEQLPISSANNREGGGMLEPRYSLTHSPFLANQLRIRENYIKQNKIRIPNKPLDAKECVKQSIPTLFSLSCSLIWQMKMLLWSQAAFYGLAGGAGLGALGVARGVVLAELVPVGGVFAAALGGIALAGVGLIPFILSLSKTGAEFNKFFKNSEEMQKSYKVQLEELLKKFGYELLKKSGCELAEELSIADLEYKITKLCQWLMQQDEIDYDYDNSEEQLNQKILEYIRKTNTSQEIGTKQENELKTLIDSKIDCLSKGEIFKNHYKTIKLRPSRGLAALLIFIQNNYRIRLCLSKTCRIGVMGSQNAGKSTLCKLLGCSIDGTGENHSTDDATLYQNVPTNRFCVIDFPHLNNTEANDTMKVFYSLSDITIIVMKSQERAKQDQPFKEIGEIIRAVKTKYSQLGYENKNRKYPVLLLFNQVDKMIFDKDGKETDDLKLYRKSKLLKQNIINTLNKYILDDDINENKVWYLFASLEPELPKPTQDRVGQWALELQNQFINQKITAQQFAGKTQELLQKGNSADKERLQQVTECSFFNWEKENNDQEYPQSVVSTLDQIIQDLGDKQGADSIIDFFKENK